MKKSACLIAALAVLVLPQAHARPDSPGSVYGVGNSSCGVWSTTRKNSPERDALMLLSWVEGYVTASILMSPRSFKQSDGVGVAVAVDNYCAKHPLDNIHSAAIDVVVSLAEP